MSDLDIRIRNVLDANARLLVSANALNDQGDLYEAGLSSHASVNVMLACEDEFGVEFPESLLRKSTFQSISSIRRTLESLGVSDASE
jgi:acyl carrier protein